MNAGVDGPQFFLTSEARPCGVSKDLAANTAPAYNLISIRGGGRGLEAVWRSFQTRDAVDESLVSAVLFDLVFIAVRC